ncbi:MAG: KpsF/GutQ family sugar-phosphate isomerase [Verrucomicrobiota bacterium]
MQKSIQLFQEVLKHEASSVNRVAGQLQHDQIEKAVKIILKSTGKVILFGVGKSGLVARKIASTMTSTGTSATFIHASDALHGDMGLVCETDVAILMSNSGETEDLLAIVPHLKHRNVPMIAIVGNLNSTLARNADAILDASIEREACPLNLAPTASTTVALAVGDALAMTISQLKGVTSEDFAVNHPSGRLGKRLTLRVADLMHSGKDNPTLPSSASWMQLIDVLAQYRLGAVNIVDKNKKLLGIVTDGDLRRVIQRFKPEEWAQLSCEKMMTRDPVTVSEDWLAYEALKLMENRPSQISVLSVLDAQQTCVGLIRLHDIIRAGL